MRHETVVLKFGSSILRSDADVASVVTEIYRRWRTGAGVVAVISAFRSRTDELLALSARVGSAGPSLGALLGVGESESSAVVALALERAGLPTHLVAPDRTGIIAEGDVTESEPAGTNPDDLRAIQRAAGRGHIVVVPGYVARSIDNAPVVLGRGGSDLTAVCLADALDTTAVLLKDTGAVFESDPAHEVVAPRAFSTLSFDDALALGDRVLQPRAIEFARRSAASFTVAGVDSSRGTVVGSPVSQLHAPGHPRPFGPPARVALLGLGTVGGGVAQRLARAPEQVELVGALVRDRDRPRHGLPRSLPTFDRAEDIWRANPDIIVELIGGIDRAFNLVRVALTREIDVVTANKALIAARHGELERLAFQHGRSIRWSAAVGGALPVLELVSAVQSTRGVAQVRGVLNGTANFVLNQIRAGNDLDTSLANAVVLGLAESDATADLTGLDAAHKLVCIARMLGVDTLGIEHVRRESIDEALLARQDGRVVRQVSELTITPTDAAASVRLLDVAPGDPLHDLPGVRNAVVVKSIDGAQIARSADGAGRWATSESVVADVLDLANPDRTTFGVLTAPRGSVTPTPAH